MTPMLSELASAFDDARSRLDEPSIVQTGEGDLESWFAVTDLAVATIGLAGLMLAQFAASLGGPEPGARVDRRLASLWFGWTLSPLGWTLPAPWDPLAGDYRAKDAWIRLHTNAPAHRAAALSVLGRQENRAALSRAVALWEAEPLEAAIVEAGGCAALMRTSQDWKQHPQGAAVSKEPLVTWSEHAPVDPLRLAPGGAQPLRGIRVLDLTRVLAGPVAGRFLAAYGADVLRIDPPHWDEPGVVPEVTLGKRCAGLDLRMLQDRETFNELVRGTDVLVHGLRPGALARLGYSGEALRALNPRLVDVSLNAYGWSGPWSQRRGFDSLVQMSSGIAEYAMRRARAERPLPLPVQALDHATGYLMAAATLRALTLRQRCGHVLSAKLSLARVASVLDSTHRASPFPGLPPHSSDDYAPRTEETAWGRARRVRFPLQIEGLAVQWRYPASELRSAPPRWE